MADLAELFPDIEFEVGPPGAAAAIAQLPPGGDWRLRQAPDGKRIIAADASSKHPLQLIDADSRTVTAVSVAKGLKIIHG